VNVDVAEEHTGYPAEIVNAWQPVPGKPVVHNTTPITVLSAPAWLDMQQWNTFKFVWSVNPDGATESIDYRALTEQQSFMMSSFSLRHLDSIAP